MSKNLDLQLNGETFNDLRRLELSNESRFTFLLLDFHVRFGTDLDTDDFDSKIWSNVEQFKKHCKGVYGFTSPSLLVTVREYTPASSGLQLSILRPIRPPGWLMKLTACEGRTGRPKCFYANTYIKLHK